MYRLRLLGGLSLTSDDGPLDGKVARRHPLALLALLASHPGRRLSRDKTIGYLWPTLGASRARARLRSTLYVIRADLTPEIIRSVGDDLQLDSTEIRSDRERFERALADEDWRAAVDAYGGPFLDGFYLNGSTSFERWVDAERDRLAGRHRRAVEELAVAAERSGEAVEAAGWWKRLAADQPYSGRLVARLMQALAAAGELGEAIAWADRHERVLREDFGAEPDKSVAALKERLRSEPPDAIPHPAPWPAPAAKEVRGQKAGSEATEVTIRARTSRDLRTGLLAGATILLVLIVIGMLAPNRSGPSSEGEGKPETLDRDRVLVPPFVNLTGDSESDVVGRMAADWIAHELARAGGLTVIPPTDALLSTHRLEEDEQRPERWAGASLARATGSGLLVSGSFTRRGDALLAHVRLVDLVDERILHALAPVQGPSNAVSEMVGELADRVVAAVATYSHPGLREWTSSASRLPPGPEAFRLYAEGMDHFLTPARRPLFTREQRTASHRRAADAFLAAAELDSTFTAPLIWAFWAFANSGHRAGLDSVYDRLLARRPQLTGWEAAAVDYLQLRMAPSDPEQNYRVAHRLVRLAPGSDWRHKLAREALATHRPREAIELLRQLEREGAYTSRWPSHALRISTAHHMLGDHESELEAARSSMRSFPNTSHFRFRRAELEALLQLGRVEQATRRIVDVGSTTALTSATLALEEAYLLGARQDARRSAQLLVSRASELETAEPREVASLRYLRARLLLVAGRPLEARRLFSELLRDTEAIELRRWRLAIFEAIAAADAGDPGPGRAVLAEDLSGDAAIQNGEEELWRAALLARLGRVAEALDAMEALLARHPVWRSHLGATYRWSVPATLFVPLVDEPGFRRLLVASPHPDHSAAARVAPN